VGRFSIKNSIAISVILFVLGFIVNGLGKVWPAFHSFAAQIVVYLLAAIVFIVWLYRDERAKNVNAHSLEVQTLAKAGRPKPPTVWTMPDDHQSPPKPQQ
jgi:hypothetical protein